MCITFHECIFDKIIFSPFQLTLSEGSSEIHHHNFPDAQEFLYLMHIPTKQSLDIATLRDINSNSDMMQGSFVNLLVAVQNVWNVLSFRDF